MRIFASNGHQTLGSPSLATMIWIARQHASNAGAWEGWKWTVEADGPAEFLELFDAAGKPDRLLAQPTDPDGVDHGNVDRATDLVST